MAHATAAPASAAALQPPAAAEAHHHGHYIMPHRTLLVVLGVLLLGTLLTVAAAQAEVFIAHTFDVVIPQWVNVAVALSIASVKSIVVAAYFMQLRYDSPVNTMVVAFTLMVLAFFLGFTMLDLGSRDALYEYKAQPKVAGGTGNIKVWTGKYVKDEDGVYTREMQTISTSIAVWARDRADKELEQLLSADPAAHLSHTLELRAAYKLAELRAAKAEIPPYLLAWEAHHQAHGHDAGHGKGHGKGHAKPAGSSEDRARPATGITLPELAPAAAPGAAAPAGAH